MENKTPFLKYFWNKFLNIFLTTFKTGATIRINWCWKTWKTLFTIVSCSYWVMTFSNLDQLLLIPIVLLRSIDSCQLLLACITLVFTRGNICSCCTRVDLCMYIKRCCIISLKLFVYNIELYAENLKWNNLNKTSYLRVTSFISI